MKRPPFGGVISAVAAGSFAEANPLRFSTKYHDVETGLANYGERVYSPRLGRWLSRDPIGDFGGPNVYNFVGNNPINRIDPFGLYYRPCPGGSCGGDGGDPMPAPPTTPPPFETLPNPLEPRRKPRPNRDLTPHIYQWCFSRCNSAFSNDDDYDACRKACVRGATGRSPDCDYEAQAIACAHGYQGGQLYNPPAPDPPLMPPAGPGVDWRRCLLVCTAVAAADGPLPVGDCVAVAGMAGVWVCCFADTYSRAKDRDDVSDRRLTPEECMNLRHWCVWMGGPAARECHWGYNNCLKNGKWNEEQWPLPPEADPGTSPW